MPSCPRHTRPFDPGCRVAGEAVRPAPPSQVRYGLDGQVGSEGQRTMQGVRDLQADHLPARLSERRSMPGRRTSALSKGETESALERPRTKDVRRATSPFDARPCPGERSGGATGPAQVLPETASRGRSADVPPSGRWMVVIEPVCPSSPFGRFYTIRQTPLREPTTVLEGLRDAVLRSVPELGSSCRYRPGRGQVERHPHALRDPRGVGDRFCAGAEDRIPATSSPGPPGHGWIRGPSGPRERGLRHPQGPTSKGTVRRRSASGRADDSVWLH